MTNLLNLISNEFKYDPDALLDALLINLSLKNDAALSKRLRVEPPIISKIRHRTMPVGPTLLIRMHEESGLSIKELRALMGDFRRKFHMSDIYHGRSVSEKLPESKPAEREILNNNQQLLSKLDSLEMDLIKSQKMLEEQQILAKLNALQLEITNSQMKLAAQHAMMQELRTYMEMKEES